jgi:hypothetical protein
LLGFKLIAATSLAGTCTVAVVELTTVVGLGRADPFHSTTEPVLVLDGTTKFVPVTVSVNAELPAPMLEGERDVTVGTGTGCGSIAKTRLLETSVVVVAVVLAAPETAEPRI